MNVAAWFSLFSGSVSADTGVLAKNGWVVSATAFSHIYNETGLFGIHMAGVRELCLGMMSISVRVLSVSQILQCPAIFQGLNMGAWLMKGPFYGVIRFWTSRQTCYRMD